MRVLLGKMNLSALPKLQFLGRNRKSILRKNKPMARNWRLPTWHSLVEPQTIDIINRLRMAVYAAPAKHRETSAQELDPSQNGGDHENH